MSPGGAAAARIRPIHARDDPAVAALIRDVLAEFGCTGPGFALHDPEVDHMHRAYPGGDRQYLVVEEAGSVRGGGGFGPLAGAPAAERVAELRKMYLRPALRGCGLGRSLLVELLARMRARGFRACYLETTSAMDAARGLYTQLGFAELDAPRGDTGHGACDRFFALDLTLPARG